VEQPKVEQPEAPSADDAIGAATRIFHMHGYSNATPALLAEALGVGKGNLYRAFGSKHDLFMACLNRYADQEYEQFRRTLAQAGTAQERIRSALDASAAADEADPEQSGCLIVNTATERGLADTEANEVVWKSMSRTRAALREVLEEGVRAGEVRSSQDLDALADMLQCTMIGLRILGRGPHNQASVYAVIETAINNI
jgi:TetR/AcrR family transcriptional repressor of nem operon